MAATAPAVGQSRTIVANSTTAECVYIDPNRTPVQYLMRYYDSQNRPAEVWCTLAQMSDGA